MSINPKRVIVPFTEEEATEIQQRLDTKLDVSHLSYRPAAQGTVAYLEGWKSFNLANEVFGFNGWSSEILNFTTDFTDVDANGKISVGLSCMVRIHLKDGTYHDDIGYGSSENQKFKGAAFEKAKKEAVTDAMKRALRIFGNRLGNCAYDKKFLTDVKIGKGGGCLHVMRSANYPKTDTMTNMMNLNVNEYRKNNYDNNNNNQNQNNNIQNIINANNTTSNSSTFSNQNHTPVPHTSAIPTKLEYFPAPSSLLQQHIQQSHHSYDEGFFDNSMMISEEDLIVDENFLIEECVSTSSNSNSNSKDHQIYPILSRNRN